MRQYPLAAQRLADDIFASRSSLSRWPDQPKWQRNAKQCFICSKGPVHSGLFEATVMSEGAKPVMGRRWMAKASFGGKRDDSQAIGEGVFPQKTSSKSSA